MENVTLSELRPIPNPTVSKLIAWTTGNEVSMTVQTQPFINSERLNQNVLNLANIGRLANGGVRRLSFSPEDLAARRQVWQWMEAAGMIVRSDAAGNIIGRLPGRYEGSALATGSHIDTVPLGGRYDGTLGVLAGIEIAHTLRDHNIQLDHPFEVIAFTDEEASMIGCKAIAGTVSLDPDRYRRKDGLSIEECLKRVGGDWSRIETAQRTRDDICAFVELHVEQGHVLESEGKAIGVVQGIVCMQRYNLTFKGVPNHAGTTPMHLRHDALVAAAHSVIAVNTLANNSPGDPVATVGMLTVWPNATNIVPGEVHTSLDVRDLSRATVEGLVNDLQEKLTEIAAQTHTEFTIQPILDVDATPAAPQIQQAIAEAAEFAQLSYMYLPSRAGHDAQEMGRLTDMGMIFVPSAGGISHSEMEYTTPEQCAQGANVLLKTFLTLDKMYAV